MSKTKISRVSVNEFEKFATNKEINCYTMTECSLADGFTFMYKTKLNLVEVTAFVDSVVNNCFINDEDNKKPDIFTPCYKDLMIYKNVIERYTNISVPLDIRKFYDWCMMTDLIDVIIGKIDNKQFNQIKNYIDETIEYNKQVSLAKSKSPVENMLCDLLDKANNYVEGLTTKFSPDTIASMIPVFEKLTKMGKLDEKVLMQTWIDSKKEETTP